MLVPVKGTIYKAGKTKKGQNFYCMLVPRPDGQQDTFTLFTGKTYEVGKTVECKVNAYIQMGSEV